MRTRAIVARRSRSLQLLPGADRLEADDDVDRIFNTDQQRISTTLGTRKSAKDDVMLEIASRPKPALLIVRISSTNDATQASPNLPPLAMVVATIGRDPAPPAAGYPLYCPSRAGVPSLDGNVARRGEDRVGGIGGCSVNVSELLRPSSISWKISKPGVSASV